MAFVVKDRVKETSTTQGTGTFTLDGTVPGFQGFSAIGDGNTTYYTITGGSQWEVGIGIYTSSGTTLSRDTVLASSNNGNLVNFSSGPKDVFVVYPAGRAVIVNGTTIEVPNLAVLPVSAGGTGSNTASFSGANISGLNASNVSSGILALANGGTGSSTASFSGANITSLNASNVTSGVLPLDHGGTGSATASFSGANITSLNASNFSSGVLPVLYGGTGSNSATFSGVNITSINASNISTGTLDNARTTASSSNGASTIVLRDVNGDFASNVITANGFTGSGANLTSLNASSVSSGTLAVARGGTNLSGIPATSILVANSTDTYTTVTPTAGQSVRVNSGGSAWEAYTPGTGTGTVTSVSGTGSYNGLSLSGTVTTSGSLTFGGTPTGTWPISVTGNSGTVTDGFYLSGTQTVTGVKYFQSNLGSTSGSLSSPPLQAYATGSNSAFMSFHRGGSYAVNMGFDSDNVLRIGGWSAPANRWQLDMSGNETLAGSIAIGGGFTIDTPGSGYGRFNNWVNINGLYGFYSSTNGAHFYVNSGTYGSWRVAGSRNGWAGLEFDPPSGGTTTLMMNRDTFGFHMNDTGWRFYNTGGSGYFPGNVVAYWSDGRLKENLRPIGSESLDIVSKFTTYRFNWNDKVKEFNIPIEPGKEEIGLIAQEVQQVLPDAVLVNKSANKALPGGKQTEHDYLTINYDRITPILIQAINELRARVEELEKKYEPFRT